MLRHFFAQFEQEGWRRRWKGYAFEGGELAAQASAIMRTFALRQLDRLEASGRGEARHVACPRGVSDAVAGHGPAASRAQRRVARGR
jgi:hypothetical protein